MCVIEVRHRESNLILRRGLSAAFAWRRSRVTSACMLAGLRILTNQATSLCTGREYSNTSAKGHLCRKKSYGTPPLIFATDSVRHMS